MKNPKIPLHYRPTKGVGYQKQELQFTGMGFAPDLHSEGAWQTLPEANATTLERGVLGADGMLPPPGHVGRPLQPGYPEGGTGGAGSFNTRVATPPIVA